MSLTWHIVGKDLRRLRWLLVLWAVVMVTWIGVACVQASLDEEGHVPFQAVATVFGGLFLPVATLGLVMALQEDDPVCGIEASWITRPITAGRLLGAKSILWGALWLAPLPFLVPFWLGHGYGPRQLGQASLATVEFQAVLTSLTIPFAAISPSGSRFVMNLLLGLVVLFVLWLAFHLDSAPADPPPGPLVASRGDLFLGVGLAAALAATLVQYRSRQVRCAVGILLGGAVLGSAVSEWWPWTLGSRRTGAAAASAGEQKVLEAACWDLALGRPVPGGLRFRPEIVAELPARPGAESVRAGVTAKIIGGLFVTAPRGLEVSLSESEPDLATFLSGPVPGLHSRAPTLEYYFLVNREDGRSLPGAPTPGSSSFEVATVRYFRSTLHFAPFTRGDGSPLPGFTDWLGKAVLVKVVARAQPPPGEGSGPDGLPRP